MDVVRGFRGVFEHAPDFVVRPRHEAEVEAVLEWCSGARVAAIPFGGGTSVVGGVSPDVGGAYNGAISIDMGALDQVLEVDEVSRAACIQAGALGPALEDQLREHALTLRHFPQSFEYSTLGGWIATRAGGHFATLWTHIEDFVESVRAITPTGMWESRRLPGSGAGREPRPHARRLGGDARRDHARRGCACSRAPRTAARRGCASVTSSQGAECVRAIAQSGLHPSNCRLLDAGEARLTMAGDGSHALLVLGFESADHPVAGGDGAGARAVRRARRRGVRGPATGGGERRGRLLAQRVPRARPTCATCSSRWACSRRPSRRRSRGSASPPSTSAVTAAAEQAVREACGARAASFCRFTHVYPDGPAPYFTVLAPARRGEEVEQWAAIKRAGLRGDPRRRRHDHPPSRGRARSPALVRPPAPRAVRRRAARRQGGGRPAGIMNPGVLIDPRAMRIAVLGPGGVGGLLAGVLDRAGSEVLVVARESTAAVIAERGLRVQQRDVRRVRRAPARRRRRCASRWTP